MEVDVPEVGTRQPTLFAHARRARPRSACARDENRYPLVLALVLKLWITCTYKVQFGSKIRAFTLLCNVAYALKLITG